MEDESGEASLFPGAPRYPALCDNPDTRDGHQEASLSALPAARFIFNACSGKPEAALH